VLGPGLSKPAEVHGEEAQQVGELGPDSPPVRYSAGRGESGAEEVGPWVITVNVHREMTCGQTFSASAWFERLARVVPLPARTARRRWGTRLYLRAWVGARLLGIMLRWGS
jgi:hypothetical protein